MNALFRRGPYLKLITRDGLNSGLIEEKEIEVEDDSGIITRYLGPVYGGTSDTDGASNPWLAQVISHLLGLKIDPYGDYYPGAVFHDLIFRRKLLQWNGGQWSKLTYVESGANPTLGQMDFARANSIFRALMFGLGTDNAKATLIYEALQEFGRTAWNDDAVIAAANPPAPFLPGNLRD